MEAKYDLTQGIYLELFDSLLDLIETEEYNAYLDEQELYSGEQEWPEDY